MTQPSPPPVATFSRFDPGPLFRTEPGTDGDTDMIDNEALPNLILAVDFGTTFSSVAWSVARRNSPGDSLELFDIRCIDNYPDYKIPDELAVGADGLRSRQDVPTEIWYPCKTSVKPRRASRIDPGASDRECVVEIHDSDSDLSSTVSLPFSSDEEDKELDEHDDSGSRTTQPLLYWGFGVQKQLANVDIPADDTRRFKRVKLVLGAEGEETDPIRAEFHKILKTIKKAHLIPKTAGIKDVISDYLEQLFAHTKTELQRKGALEGIADVELVLCVPALWPSRACRLMQAAMATAAERTGMSRVENSSLTNLFIISEPEAAAACILAQDSYNVYPGETILILDAGGGTVDAVTYEVTSAYPLRLSAEVVSPSSKLCGASHINERFARLLLKKLKSELYLVKNGKTIKSIVEDQVIKFENNQKRTIDVTKKKCDIEPVWIDDVQPNPQKGLLQNRVDLKRKEMIWIFQESLEGAAAVLKAQLDLAKANKSSVSKVLLTGGFGKSKSLQSHLRRKLADETNFDEQRITLLTEASPSTTVARGAVLRAYNKALGPTRKIQNSYGVLHWEPYEPEVCEAHRGTRCVIDKADGERYVDSTINWLIQKGTELETMQEFPITVRHTFAHNRPRFICEEELYVSDDWHPLHFRKTHPKNKGAELAGNIIVDMTFLRDEGHIELVEPSEFSKFAEGDKRHKDRRYWIVKFELVLIVDGRKLYFEARYPARDDEEAASRQGRLLARKQTCMAASFKPGTE